VVEKRGKKHQTQQQIFVRCSWLGLSERFVVLSDLLNEHHRVAPLVESLAQNRDYTHLPISFERFRCEVNRKKSKFE
jgi:hypothetical protein